MSDLIGDRSVEETFRLFDERYLPFANNVAYELGLPKVNRIIIKRGEEGVFLDGNGLKLKIECPDADDPLPFESWRLYYSDIARNLMDFQVRGKGFLPADNYCQKDLGLMDYVQIHLYGIMRSFQEQRQPDLK